MSSPHNDNDARKRKAETQITKNDNDSDGSTAEDGGPKFCRSAKVKNATHGLQVAANAINDLEESQRGREKELKLIFYEKMDERFQQSGINDAEELSYSSHMKTEFAAEFNLDAVADAISKALKVAATTAAAAEAPFLAPEAIKSYADLVTSLAECAKSSSKAANNLSFDMIHLSPGIIAFLFAVSTTATDKSVFGEESVTCTVLFHCIVSSKRALGMHSEFSSALHLADTIRRFERVRATLVEDWSNGKLTDVEFDQKDQFVSNKLDQLKIERDAMKKSTSNIAKMALHIKENTASLFKRSDLGLKIVSVAPWPTDGEHSMAIGTALVVAAAESDACQDNEEDNLTENEQIVRTALTKLQQNGHVSENILLKLQQRLEVGFYS